MTQETSAPAPLKAQLWDLTWQVMLSALYHQKRERFLDGIDRFSQCVGVLGGAAAFTQVLTEGGKSWPAGVVAIVSALSLCYGPGAKARKHSELAREFKRLHAKIRLAGDPTDGEDLRKFNADYLLLEAEEPAALRCLVRQCENELSEALGHPEDVRRLCWWDRLWMNVVDLDPSRNDEPTAVKPAVASAAHALPSMDPDSNTGSNSPPH